ncbi:integral peroxisomal membrane peroxin-domain-containing protein [Syncephalastrum racemosum]|uniref:Integral peroxisomal membrane peroxin-domain-containing protein n=1 Tax=Syncephalastrum racemosum TaxID=13706 RepID=A0A1X2HJ78_SYNRA|nr:integral peroxisomal membrane peroxin-domain-containing protein [Syncephalastrum racemosum]
METPPAEQDDNYDSYLGYNKHIQSSRVYTLLKRTRHGATWKGPFQDSLLVLAAWWMLCLQFWAFLIYIVPLIPLMWAASTWPTQSDHEKSSPSLVKPSAHKRRQQVQELVQSLDSQLQRAMDCLEWSKDPASTRVLFAGLVYFYIFWVTAHQIVSTRHIMLVLGTLLLLWQSPVCVHLRDRIQFSLLQSAVLAIFFGQRDHAMSLQYRALHYQAQRLLGEIKATDFVFVLFENQRSWPLGQWASPFPMERAPWCDEANETTTSKTEFTLPKDVEIVMPDETRPGVEYRKSWKWSWVDEEWQLNDTQANKDGWEYGSLVWTTFDAHPKGYLSTRRRRWQRRATIEYRVDAVQTQRMSVFGDIKGSIQTAATRVVSAEQPVPQPLSPSPRTSHQSQQQQQQQRSVQQIQPSLSQQQPQQHHDQPESIRPQSPREERRQSSQHRLSLNMDESGFFSDDNYSSPASPRTSGLPPRIDTRHHSRPSESFVSPPTSPVYGKTDEYVSPRHNRPTLSTASISAVSGNRDELRRRRESGTTTAPPASIINRSQASLSSRRSSISSKKGGRREAVWKSIVPRG